MKKDLYAVVDLEGYAKEMRLAAAKSLVENITENLDEYISIQQIINLVKEECVGFDDDDRPLLNEDSNEKIYESVSIWIHSVGLAKLAAQNLIEFAWDDKSNDMVFWSKSEN